MECRKGHVAEYSEVHKMGGPPQNIRRLYLTNDFQLSIDTKKEDSTYLHNSSLSPFKNSPYPLPCFRQPLFCYPAFCSLVVYTISFRLLCSASGECSHLPCHQLLPNHCPTFEGPHLIERHSIYTPYNLIIKLQKSA